MKYMTKAALVASIAILPACAVPPNETAAQRAERINRGTTVAVVLIAISLIVPSILADEILDD